MITNSSLPFVQLFPGVGVGSPVPHGWHSLVDAPLLIIVGVTGVGKSTTLAHLAQSGFTSTLLPNRRDLTDRLIISTMQTLDGEPNQLVADRKTRFDYTRRYRVRFPGGMSHALTQLWVDLAQLGRFSSFRRSARGRRGRTRQPTLAAGTFHCLGCTGRGTRATFIRAQRCLRSDG